MMSPESVLPMKIAFLLRYRDNYFYEEEPDDTPDNTYTWIPGAYLSSGLYNSARLVAEMLHEKFGYDATVDQLPDSNYIDAYVTQNKPDVVVLEAYWVTPDKLKVLSGLHPDITWIVRNHSSISFLSLEGVVMEWSQEYVNIDNVILSCNDPRTNSEFARLIQAEHPDWDRPEICRRVVLLPNYYPAVLRDKHPKPFRDREIDIACFGAIRPLKNQLMQAIAAVMFCQGTDLTLRYHINGTRVEQGGEPILKNIRSLFAKNPQHQLIEHPWLPHDEFLDIMEGIDIAMQVSFSETFNITTADAVTFGIPVVVSPEVWWVHPMYKVNASSEVSIERGLDYAYMSAYIGSSNDPNLGRLAKYDEWSANLWNQFLNSPALHGDRWGTKGVDSEQLFIGSMPNFPKV